MSSLLRTLRDVYERVVFLVAHSTGVFGFAFPDWMISETIKTESKFLDKFKPLLPVLPFELFTLDDSVAFPAHCTFVRCCSAHHE